MGMNRMGHFWESYIGDVDVQGCGTFDSLGGDHIINRQARALMQYIYQNIGCKIKETLFFS